MVATNAQGWILVGQSIPSVIETVDIRRMVEHTCRASIWMDEYHSEPLYADDVTFIRVGLIGVPTVSLKTPLTVNCYNLVRKYE